MLTSIEVPMTQDHEEDDSLGGWLLAIAAIGALVAGATLVNSGSHSESQSPEESPEVSKFNLQSGKSPHLRSDHNLTFYNDRFTHMQGKTIRRRGARINGFNLD